MSSKVVIHDASVLIDLCQSGLLDSWLRVGYSAYTTRYIVAELENDTDRGLVEAYADGGSLVIRELDLEEDVIAILRIAAESSSALSFQDCSVLLLATDLKAILLTGDGALRNHAQRRSLEVHGMLWVLDSLVESRSMAPVVAAERLSALMEKSFYPIEECEKRLRRWRHRETT